MSWATAKDLTGRTFGKLTVLSRAETPPKSNRAHWECRCECGAITVKNGKYLLSGDTSSCGCVLNERLKAGNIKHRGIMHGHATREYTIWRSMKSRCLVKSTSNFKHYGGRGITICERWRDFAAFLADMGPCPDGHTLERINNDGPYAPTNCRWATWTDQHNNTRRSRFVTAFGQRMTLSQAAKKHGVNYLALRWRIESGLSVDDAIRHLRSR